jgi:hypothetical protein
LAQTLNLKISGLYTAPNPFSGAPDGGLLVADDVVVDQTNLGGPRRGFNLLPGALPLDADRINRFDYYRGLVDSQAYLMGQWGETKFGYYDAGVWTPYAGSFAAPDPVLARVRFLQQNRNLYFTTSDGIYKLDSVESNTPKAAGVPPGLDIELDLTGTSGFFSENAVGSFVGTLTNASPVITGLTSLPGNIAVGNYISDPLGHIPAGTTVLSIAASATVLTATGNIAAASTSMTTVSPTTGIAIGQTVTGAGIPFGTTVTNIVATTVTLSNAATATTTGVTVVFASAPTITMSANATATATETLTYSTGAEVAYRLVWGYKDANNNLLLGAPTQWISIANTTGSSRNILVTSSIPAEITTAYFYQVYRSFQTPTSSVTPSDEMQLCYAGNPSGTDISNGYIQFTDNLVDALLGTSLYTSPSVAGIGQAYNQPPMAKDFCSFFGYTFYANTTSQHTLNLTMIGVGSPSGVQSGDTIEVGGITFTGAAAENIATNTFKVFTAGTPAQNITDTTNSLVRVMNRSATSLTYAYNISGPTDLPGKMLLTTRSFGGAVFAVTATQHAGVSPYNPALPTSGTSVSSAQVTYQNGVFASVLGQPEAVPLANLLPLAGSSAEPILRIIALRDYVVLLKTDGVFRIVGNSLSNFQVLPFDYTTKLVAPDSAVSLNNQVWCLTNQGVVSISDTGVQQQSWTNINNVIQQLFGVAYETVAQFASAVSYETEHKYILGLPTAAGDGGNTQTYTYNIFTSAWTRWSRQFTAGFIHPTLNVLYLGNFQNNNVVTERKTGTYQDFVDELSASPTVTGHSEYDVTLDSVSGIVVGDLLYQDATHASVITDIDITTNTVTVTNLIDWVNGPASVFAAMNSAIQWKPVVAGNPGYLRQYTEGDLLFNTTAFNTATLFFSTELYQSFSSVPLVGNSLGDWGLFPWGEATWGGATLPTPIRFYIPLNAQLGSQLNVRFAITQAWSNWSLEGVNIVYNDVSEEMDG